MLTKQIQFRKGEKIKFGIFLGLRASWHKTNYFITIFIKIMQAVGLGYIQCIGPIPFQTIEQNIVQRCEPHIEAKSCKAFQLFLDKEQKKMQNY